MCSIPVPPAIASAAVVFFGRYGAVSDLARQRGVLRQTVYREAHAAAAKVQGSEAEQRLEQLRQRLAEQAERLAALEEQLRQAVVIDADKQAEFAGTAQALGISLSAARALLRVLLKALTPSVSQLGRLAQEAGRKASAALAVLDAFSRPRARQIAADEIFAGRRPVLVTVEQESLCWLGGRLAASRDAPEWAQEFRQLPAAEQVTRDGGVGLRKGLATVNAQRRQAGQAVIADQEDHFHLLQRARRAVREVRHKAVRAFRKAEEAQKPFDHAGRAGLPRSAAWGRAVRQKWRQAEQAWDRWAAQEQAFGRLRSGLRLFTPEGTLNTRARAEAEVRQALAELTGPEWQRARRRLVRPETFTFLDRTRDQLAELPGAAAAKDLLVHREGLRRQPEALRGDSPRAAALRGVVLVAGVLVAQLGAQGEAMAQAVCGVLRRVWRASSLVEGLNSVLRMHQARQKRLTQGLVDLKRLYWNLHVFAAGRRKGQSPYQHLGLLLPAGDWRSLLKMTPEQLHQQLSELNPAA